MVNPAVSESIRTSLMRLPAANIDTSFSRSNCRYAINKLTFETLEVSWRSPSLPSWYDSKTQPCYKGRNHEWLLCYEEVQFTARDVRYWTYYTACSNVCTMKSLGGIGHVLEVPLVSLSQLSESNFSEWDYLMFDSSKLFDTVQQSQPLKSLAKSKAGQTWVIFFHLTPWMNKRKGLDSPIQILYVDGGIPLLSLPRFQNAPINTTGYRWRRWSKVFQQVEG